MAETIVGLEQIGDSHPGWVICMNFSASSSPLKCRQALVKKTVFFGYLFLAGGTIRQGWGWVGRSRLLEVMAQSLVLANHTLLSQSPPTKDSYLP